MPTLSDASQETRKFMKYAAIFLVFLIIALIIFNLILILKNTFYPPPPPKASSAFGLLPPQTFPNGIPSDKFTYNINTLSGSLPSFPQVINVYRMQQNIPNLLDINRMNDKAGKIGFNSSYKQISDNIYQWNNDTRSGAIGESLSANIVSGDFTITSNYMNDPGVMSGKNLPDQPTAINLANSLVASMGSVDDLDSEKTKTTLYAISNGTLIKASSLSRTQVIQVSIFQKDIDNLPIYYEKPNQSNINILTAGGNLAQIVAASYVHQIPTKESASYNIKTADQAFNELKQGKAYVASYNGQSNNININNVILAYYISVQPQDFLMPIYIFSGDNNFYAYVSAITDGSISN